MNPRGARDGLGASSADVRVRIEEKDIHLHSLLIIRNGYLVTEAYFEPYDQATYHQMASMTKSVTGILVGMAIDKGNIKSADQQLLSFFPERTVANLDAKKQAIALKHLLSLTCGLSCMDKLGSDQEVQQSKDWVQFMLDLPMLETPGAHFSYCTGAVHLLSAIIQETTGMTARDFANEQLFKPLGIAQVPLARWGSDPQGITTGGFGLQLQPRDMAKLGYLYLNQGKWADRQIVSSDWVTLSTKNARYGKSRIEPMDTCGGFIRRRAITPPWGWGDSRFTSSPN